MTSPPTETPAAGADAASADAARASRPAIAWIVAFAGIAACLALLLWHIRLYWFMSDDAYIAFRYARNLSEGFGLVFNPGFERVEGYTCFLWVALLAGFDAAGLPPHVVANWISAALGVALWIGVFVYCARTLAPGARPWLLVVPALFLASNRSYAMWSTGGLETKLYEVLIVSGVLLAAHEARGERGRWWPSALLFALASLTRPDALLIAFMVFTARAIHELKQRKLHVAAVGIGASVYLAIVGAHFAFRLAYYGEWLPNTYYAKLDAQSWWDLGLTYLAAFALEYAMWLWLPLIAIGAFAFIREGRSIVPLLAAAAIIPHALYIAYAGGDNFEYRPINLYIPFYAIFIYAGVREIATRWRLPVIAGAWGIASCAAAAFIPALTHLDFPPVLYRPGFPGWSMRLDGTRELVSSERHVGLFEIPGLREYLDVYNRVYADLTSHFGGLRQEEQSLHLETVVRQGQLLARMIDEGLLPPDTHIATRSVGAIPYFSRLRTLDMLGLTDAHVAHSPMPPNEQRMIAHGKQATADYLQSQGVDVSALVVNFLTRHPAEIDAIRETARAAGGQGTDTGIYISKPLLGGYRFHGLFTMPLEEARERFPKLDLRSAAE